MAGFRPATIFCWVSRADDTIFPTTGLAVAVLALDKKLVPEELRILTQGCILVGRGRRPGADSRRRFAQGHARAARRRGAHAHDALGPRHPASTAWIRAAPPHGPGAATRRRRRGPARPCRLVAVRGPLAPASRPRLARGDGLQGAPGPVARRLPGGVGRDPDPLPAELRARGRLASRLARAEGPIGAASRASCARGAATIVVPRHSSRLLVAFPHPEPGGPILVARR